MVRRLAHVWEEFGSDILTEAIAVAVGQMFLPEALGLPCPDSAEGPQSEKRSIAPERHIADSRKRSSYAHIVIGQLREISIISVGEV